MGTPRVLVGVRAPALALALALAAFGCRKDSPEVWEPIDADFKGCEGG